MSSLKRGLGLILTAGLAVAATACSATTPPDYEVVGGKKRDGKEPPLAVLVDRNTLSRTGDKVVATYLSIYNSPFTYSPGTIVSHFDRRITVFCGENRFNVDHVTYYRPDDSVLQDNDLEERFDVVKGSASEQLYNYACFGMKVSDPATFTSRTAAVAAVRELEMEEAVENTPNH